MTSESESLQPQHHCCVCPYCETDLQQPLPTCVMCGRQVRYCSECGSPVKKEDEVCANCGAHRPTSLQDAGAR